jgi:cyclase
MPFAVGGGIRNVQQIRDILHAGAEKVAFSTAAVETPQLISEAASLLEAKVWWSARAQGKNCIYRRFSSNKTRCSRLGYKSSELGAEKFFLTLLIGMALDKDMI